ncbi:GntR family transcriptional regulator [Streptomyces sp. NPDC090306]|uniref:GntR family transcriptional regulator n=1 Tax=Streptomyces sp. NPDC090306 TaxID=3365961 RepID=UPI0037F2CAFD
MPSRPQKVAEDLRARITSGALVPGERLPSEANLSTQYGVSTATLRRALADLQSEGLVAKVHGKGNFVARPLRKILYVSGWGTMDPHTAADAVQHVTVDRSTIPADAQLAELLRVPAGSPLTELRCVSYDRDSPHSLARVYLPHPPPAAEEHATPSSAELARFAVLHPSPAVLGETAPARLPTPDEAAALRLNPGAPVLSLTRVVRDSEGRPAEAALLVLPGDRAEALFATDHHAHHTQEPR